MKFTIYISLIKCICIFYLDIAMGCNSKGNTLNPKTVTDLQSVLHKASPGDTIELFPIDYTGDFVLPDKGSSSAITLKGTNLGNSFTTIIGSKTALDIVGGSWNILDLAINSGEQGVNVKGSNHLLKSLSISGVDQAVIVNGDGNKLESLSIKLGTKGITINGNKTEVKDTSCNGQKSYAVNVESGKGTVIRSLSTTDSEKYSLILGPGTCCGTMKSLSLDGVVEVKGKSYQFQSLSSKGAVNLFGCKNSFSSSSIEKIYVTKECKNSLELEETNAIRAHLDQPV